MSFSSWRFCLKKATPNLCNKYDFILTYFCNFTVYGWPALCPQVEYTTLQSQLSSQLSQQEGLKTRHARLEMDHENLQHKHEGLQSTHSSLVSDHESLQHLHEQLTSEYESLVSEHGSLKSMHKSLKMELKDSQEQLDSLLMVG